MSIPIFFAVSGQDIRNISPLPSRIAWMSCHFSPHDPGLTDLPARLPKGSMLILDDRLPMKNHDPDLILRQLQATVEKFSCSYLLLELQREGQNLPVEKIIQAVPCPVGITPDYARGLTCSVFLPPVPAHIPIGEYLEPWSDRSVWLEIAPDGTDITVTPQGTTVTSKPFPEVKAPAHRDDTLCCHYTISTQANSACFSLYRTCEDIQDLLNHAPRHVQLSIGLHSELSPLLGEEK